MPTAWRPKTTAFDEAIAEEEARNALLDYERNTKTWEPPTTQPIDTFAPPIEQPQGEIPQSQYELPERDMFVPETYTSEPVWQPPTDEEPISFTRPQTQPLLQKSPVSTVAETPKMEKKYTSRSPFEIDENLPLWAKTINWIGKPFELIQNYLFNPLLVAAHLPFTRTLTQSETKLATKEGIRSYLPGGVRYKAYEDLEYFGKWAVEMLPWLIVPPIGAVGKAAKAGTGIAGVLARTGKAGEFAGRALEYSPAGLAEKAIGGVVGAVTGKTAAKAAQAAPQTQDPLILKAVNSIRAIQKSQLPEQKALTHELRVQQLKKAMPELQKANGETALHNFMKALRGEGEKVEWQGIRNQLTQEEINKLSDMISKSSKVLGLNKAPAIKGWGKILDGPEIPYASELEQLEKVFGSDIVMALTEKQANSVFNKVMDVANAPRAVLSSVDLSGLLRQGAILTTRHPVEAAKTVKPMVKAFFSDKNALVVDDIIRNRANTALGEQFGLYLAPLPSKSATTALSKMEESFMSKWIESVPVLGSAVKASNRAYVTGLNDLRSRVWENTISTWQKTGQQIADVDYKELALLINAASGRGSLPRVLQGASPLINATLFSPRFFVSHFQFPTKILSPSPLVRKEAARQLVQFLGTGTAILGMARLAGAKVETDPRSADFGKIRIGNSRLDIWSGYVQYARFIAQLATAERKSQYGNITELNRRDVVDRFVQSKYSPAFGLINDILHGESYSGEDVSLDSTSVQRQAYTRLMPLFIQDMMDAIEQDGLIGGMVASPALFGIGVVTYLSPAQKMRDQLAQETYGLSWEQLGQTKGLAAQLELERSSPKLLALIQHEQEDYSRTITGKTDINNVYRNQTRVIEDQYRFQIQQAAQEYRDTQDGYIFKEKVLKAADNRRSQYDILNKDPQFAKIVARYNELPNPSDLQRLSPQDWARKEYMRLLYSPDMYDQYGNYRFDMVDDIKQLFTQTFGQEMLDYVETYQGIKEYDMPPEYYAWKQAQKTLKPYWEVQDRVIKLFGKTFAESNRGQAFISKQRKALRLTNPAIAQAYDTFYRQT